MRERERERENIRLVLIGLLDIPEWNESIRRIYSADGVCPTICAVSNNARINISQGNPIRRD